MIDYLIIGQGIAGTTLAHTLLKSGKTIRVVDNNRPGSASKASSGICNPITGRRLVKTWLASEVFPFLKIFYTELEKELEAGFFFEKQVYRPFKSVRDQNEWFGKKEVNDWNDFVETEIEEEQYTPFVDNPWGGWETKQGCWVDVPLLIELYHTYLLEKGFLIEEEFVHADLCIGQDGVEWKSMKAKKVIFCEGRGVLQNPYFNYLPFRLDKGEWIKIRIEGEKIDLSHLIKQNVFIIPLQDGCFLVSGTYHWDTHTTATTTEAREDLTERLDKVLKLPYKVVDQKAGIRTSARHRRPIIGRHPKHLSLFIFNGFGTKGVSLSPFFAEKLVNHIESAEDLHEEVTIQKYSGEVIYHICTRKDWQAVQEAPNYQPASLKTEGFIHCSTKTQVLDTGKRYFRGQKGLIVLHIEALAVESPVYYENLLGGSLLFPHIYGVLNMDAVIRTSPFDPEKEHLGF